MTSTWQFRGGGASKPDKDKQSAGLKLTGDLSAYDKAFPVEETAKFASNVNYEANFPILDSRWERASKPILAAEDASQFGDDDSMDTGVFNATDEQPFAGIPIDDILAIISADAVGQLANLSSLSEAGQALPDLDSHLLVVNIPAVSGPANQFCVVGITYEEAARTYEISDEQIWLICDADVAAFGVNGPRVRSQRHLRTEVPKVNGAANGLTASFASMAASFRTLPADNNFGVQRIKTKGKVTVNPITIPTPAVEARDFVPEESNVVAVHNLRGCDDVEIYSALLFSGHMVPHADASHPINKQHQEACTRATSNPIRCDSTNSFRVEVPSYLHHFTASGKTAADGRKIFKPFIEVPIDVSKMFGRQFLFSCHPGLPVVVQSLPYSWPSDEKYLAAQIYHLPCDLALRGGIVSAIESLLRARASSDLMSSPVGCFPLPRFSYDILLITEMVSFDQYKSVDSSSKYDAQKSAKLYRDKQQGAFPISPAVMTSFLTERVHMVHTARVYASINHIPIVRETLRITKGAVSVLQIMGFHVLAAGTRREFLKYPCLTSRQQVAPLAYKSRPLKANADVLKAAMMITAANRGNQPILRMIFRTNPDGTGYLMLFFATDVQSRVIQAPLATGMFFTGPQGGLFKPYLLTPEMLEGWRLSVMLAAHLFNSPLLIMQNGMNNTQEAHQPFARKVLSDMSFLDKVPVMFFGPVIGTTQVHDDASVGTCASEGQSTGTAASKSRSSAQRGGTTAAEKTVPVSSGVEGQDTAPSALPLDTAARGGLDSSKNDDGAQIRSDEYGREVRQPPGFSTVSGSRETTSLTSSLDECQNQVILLRRQVEEEHRLHAESRLVIESLYTRIGALEVRVPEPSVSEPSIQAVVQRVTELLTDVASLRSGVADVAGSIVRADADAAQTAASLMEMVRQVDATESVYRDLLKGHGQSSARIDKLEAGSGRDSTFAVDTPTILRRIDDFAGSLATMSEDVHFARAVSTEAQRTGQEAIRCYAALQTELQFEKTKVALVEQANIRLQRTLDEYQVLAAVADLEQHTAQGCERLSEGEGQVSADEYPRVASLALTVDRLLEWSGITDQPLSFAQQLNAVGVAGRTTMAIGDEAADAALLRAYAADRLEGDRTMTQRIDELARDIGGTRVELSEDVSRRHAEADQVSREILVKLELLQRTVGQDKARVEAVEEALFSSSQSDRDRVSGLEDKNAQILMILEAYQSLAQRSTSLLESVSSQVDHDGTATLSNSVVRGVVAGEFSRQIESIRLRVCEIEGSLVEPSVHMGGTPMVHEARSMLDGETMRQVITMSAEADRIAREAAIDAKAALVAVGKERARVTAVEAAIQNVGAGVASNLQDLGNGEGSGSDIPRGHFSSVPRESADRLYELAVNMFDMRDDVETVTAVSLQTQGLFQEALARYDTMLTEVQLERARLAALETAVTSIQVTLGPAQAPSIISQGLAEDELADRVEFMLQTVDRLVEWSGITDQPRSIAQQFDAVGVAGLAAIAIGDEAAVAASVRADEAERAIREAVLQYEGLHATVTSEQTRLDAVTASTSRAQYALEEQLRHFRESAPAQTSQGPVSSEADLWDRVGHLTHTVDQLVEWSGLTSQTNSYALQFEAVTLEFQDLHKAIIASRGAVLQNTVTSIPLQVLPDRAFSDVTFSSEVTFSSGRLGEVVHAHGVQINQNYSDIYHLTREIQAGVIALKRLVDSKGEELHARVDIVEASTGVMQEVLGLVAEAASVDLHQLMTTVDANDRRVDENTAEHASSGHSASQRGQQELLAQPAMDTDFGTETGGRKRKLLPASIQEAHAALLAAPPARVMRVEDVLAVEPASVRLEIGTLLSGPAVEPEAERLRPMGITDQSERDSAISSSTGVAMVTNGQSPSTMVGHDTGPTATVTSTEMVVRGSDEGQVVGTRRRSTGGRILIPQGGLYNIPEGSHVVLLQMVAFQSADEMPSGATSWVRQQRRIEALQIVLPVGTKVFTLGSCPEGLRHFVDESAHVHFKSGSRGRSATSSEEKRRALQGSFRAGSVGGIFLDYDVFTNDHLVTLGSVSNNGAGAGTEIFSYIAFLLLDGNPNAIAVIPNPATYFLDALLSPAVRGLMLQHQLAVDYGSLDSHLLYRHRLTDPEDVRAVLGSSVLVIMRASHPRAATTGDWVIPPAVPRRMGYQPVPLNLTLDYDTSCIPAAVKKLFYEGKFPCHCPVPCGDDCPSKSRRRFCGPYNCLHPDCTNVFDRGSLPCGEMYVTPDMGYGLRARGAIYPDRFITGFAGHLLGLSAEGLSGQAERVFQHSNSVVLLRSTFTHLFVVACGDYQERHGRLGQYVNHSCRPNCRLEVWADEFGVPTAWIRSNTLIGIGEAFTINYNQVVSDESDLTECLCGLEGLHYMQKFYRGTTFPGKIVSTNGAHDTAILQQEARDIARPIATGIAIAEGPVILAHAIAIGVAGPEFVVEVPPLPDPSSHSPRSV